MLGERYVGAHAAQTAAQHGHSRKTRHSLFPAQCIGVEIHTVLDKLNQAGVKPRIRRNDENSPLSKFTNDVSVNPSRP